MFIDPNKISPVKIYSRVVSLVPSQTELLYDLGLKEEVIGITKFCVHPNEWYRNKTRIGGTKTVNMEPIHKLNPDLIICNKEENVKEQVEELASYYDVVVTDVNNLPDALNMINEIGSLIGKRKEALHISNKINREFQKLHDTIAEKKKIKSAYLIWKDPLMTVGKDTFINDMMRYCGLENIFSSAKRYPEISLEDLRHNCELILLSSEPYPFKEKHLTEMQLKISNSKIMLVDGEMFSWYGSRLLKAADYFEKIINKITRL